MADFPLENGNPLSGPQANRQVGAVIAVEAGENITADDVVYINSTDGKAYVSDIGNQPDFRANGIALTTATTGNDVEIRTAGVWITTGLTDKEDYYLGASGAVTTTISRVRLGTALSTTDLYLDIKQDNVFTFIGTSEGTSTGSLTTLTAIPVGALQQDDMLFIQVIVDTLNVNADVANIRFTDGTNTITVGLTVIAPRFTLHPIFVRNDDLSDASRFIAMFIPDTAADPINVRPIVDTGTLENNWITTGNLEIDGQIDAAASNTAHLQIKVFRMKGTN